MVRNAGFQQRVAVDAILVLLPRTCDSDARLARRVVRLLDVHFTGRVLVSNEAWGNERNWIVLVRDECEVSSELSISDTAQKR